MLTFDISKCIFLMICSSDVKHIFFFAPYLYIAYYLKKSVFADFTCTAVHF